MDSDPAYTSEFWNLCAKYITRFLVKKQHHKTWTSKNHNLLKTSKLINRIGLAGQTGRGDPFQKWDIWLSWWWWYLQEYFIVMTTCKFTTSYQSIGCKFIKKCSRSSALFFHRVVASFISRLYWSLIIYDWFLIVWPLRHLPRYWH